MKEERRAPFEFTLRPSDFRFLGRGLNRPECVVALGGGLMAVGDWDGGVAIIDSRGGVRKILASRQVFGEKLLPNGVAAEADGTFLLTHLSQQHGGVFRLHPDGRLDDVLLNVDGLDLPPTNFVLRDSWGRVWITVSTRVIPRFQARTLEHADGFIVLLDGRGARIAADGLGFTNEVRVDSSGQFLYVNETFGRRLTRFHIDSAGDLRERTVVTSFGHGTFPDGLTLDAEGGFWITSVFSNRILRVSPDGEQHRVFEDCEPVLLDEIERSFLSGELARSSFKGSRGAVLGNISSLVFTGPDGREAVLGCLDDSRLTCFRSPVAGADRVP